MTCDGCRNGEALDFDFSMAFQPIVDIEARCVWAYEALARGPAKEPADTVLSRVTPENRYAFDQRCRVKAIEKAVAAGILDTDARLSINFLPNAVYSPQACIQLTLKTARETGFPTDRLIFEFTENEEMIDTGHVANIIETYREMGFGTALDDFGAGHAGLGLLASFQPDIVKFDRELVRDIDFSMPRRVILEAALGMCEKLGIVAVAEGIETAGEVETLRVLGVRYMQGFYFARPAFEALPGVAFDQVGDRAAVG